MNIKYLLIFFWCSTFFISCNVINPPEKVPTYIHIDSFKFVNSTNAAAGTNSHNISTVVATYNGMTVGTFDLPATFPIIASGNGTLILSPGISIDGLNNYVGAYDFYTIDTSTFTANPGKTINYNPTTRYTTKNINFPFSENFDVTNAFAFSSGMDSIRRIVKADSVFEGSGAGIIHLTHLGDSSENIAIKDFTVPNHVGFIELNYKSSMKFSIGIQPSANSIGLSPSYIISFYPSAKWTKVYINMIDIINSYTNGDYKVCIKAGLPVEDGQSEGYVLLDNIKVVTN